MYGSQVLLSVELGCIMKSVFSLAARRTGFDEGAPWPGSRR
jgi:hypothetical protein